MPIQPKTSKSLPNIATPLLACCTSAARDRGRAAEVGVREEEGDVVEVRRYGRVGDGEEPMLALTQLSNYLTI